MHPFIIDCYEALLTPRFLCIVMEYAPHRNLHAYLNERHRPLSEPEARFIFRQLMIGVHYMHGRVRCL